MKIFLEKLVKYNWKILIITIILLIFIFSKAESVGYLEEFGPEYNFREIEIKDSNGNRFELEFLLFTFDMLRTNRIDFSNDPVGELLKENIAFNVYIENNGDSTIKYDLNQIKLILNKKEISPVIINDIENPVKYTEVGTIGFPVNEIPNFDFKNFKLAIETKEGRKYINVKRKNLMYDFTERFREDIPQKIKHPYLISKPKLLVLNRDNDLEEKGNIDRDTVSNISISFSLERPRILWFRDPTIRCEWYNKNGFYSEEKIEDIKDRKFKFSLNKDDLKENVGIWSVLIYINKHLISHRTFLVY